MPVSSMNRRPAMTTIRRSPLRLEIELIGFTASQSWKASGEQLPY
jgi:hypothetical protein